MVRPEKKTILIFSTIFTCSILHFDLQFYKKSKFDIQNIRFDEFIKPNLEGFEIVCKTGHCS